MSETLPETPAVETPAEPTEPAWSGPSQDEWQATQERLAQFEAAQAPQQPQYQPLPPQGPPIPDPWERPETYAQDFEAYAQHLMQPLTQLQYEMQQQEGTERAMEFFGGIAEREGAFDRDMAWTVARQMAQERPAQNQRESEQLLSEAAKRVREYERTVGEQYHQQQLEQAQVNAGVRPGLPLGATGSQTIATGGLGNTPNAVTRKFFGTP